MTTPKEATPNPTPYAERLERMVCAFNAASVWEESTHENIVKEAALQLKAIDEFLLAKAIDDSNPTEL
jgi:hypothetical protein